jgi:hypothetical protein
MAFEMAAGYAALDGQTTMISKKTTATPGCVDVEA